MTARDPIDARDLAWLAGGWLSLTLAVGGLLESAAASSTLFSDSLWRAVLAWLGGRAAPDGGASVPLASCGLIAVGLLGLAAGAVRRRGRAVAAVGRIALLPGAWWVAQTAALVGGLSTAAGVLAAGADLPFALAAAGWLTLALKPRPDEADWRPRTAWLVVGGAAAAYAAAFTAMNWGLYWSLRTPHGDTAMYEEHLWNLLHGKGFRSYLDQGLFLGEHVQVAHLLLIPIYRIYPSHLTMELCESVALASTAAPAFLLARRFGGSNRAAAMLAVAVLLAAPLHYLDIEIDRKSFRPMSLGVPAALWAMEFLEARRWRAFAVAAAVALAAKEDFALIIGPLGVWLAATEWRDRRLRTVGLVIAAAAGVYLLLAVKVVIPFFRGGETVHYARYFPQFGETPAEILWGMLTQPHVVAAAVVTAPAVVYVLRTFAPLGFASLLSRAAASRLLVGLPELGLLLLNGLSMDPPAPVHHFHGPLLPVLFWSAAASLRTGWRREPSPGRRDAAAAWAVSAALCVGATMGFGPLSVAFWDAGRPMHWRSRYVPDERAEQFANVRAVVPSTARVASTDYVHPRFTHHERSYDYSGYVRRVAGDTTAVPADAEYVVIDVRGPYSTIRGPEDVRELREHPDEWQLLDLDTGGYFLVLRRKPAGPRPEPAD